MRFAGKAIQLTKLRDLDLAAPIQAGRGAFISAASGLVRAGGWLHVIADDEHHLASFEVGTTRPGRVFELLPGTLPVPKNARKQDKPDFESLLRLPAFSAHAHGALLALGSGSRPNRRRAALVGLDALGAIAGSPQVIALEPFYERLQRDFPELNLEAAAVVGDELWLLQRGGKSGAANACIHVVLDAFLELLHGPARALEPRAVQILDLGEIDGLPLCFSDATLLADSTVLFTAITEDTDNSFEDGRCGGAAIGILAADGSMRMLGRALPTVKMEGIDARRYADRIEVLLVTDDDDPEQASALYAAQIDWGTALLDVA
jgi:hypothetical protein